jgi:DNA-binding CsgD family transcriptional regulator
MTSKKPKFGSPGFRAFVGRSKELDALWQALDLARSGSGGIVMISGEAGAGKTRLAKEFVHAAEERGVPLCSGRCLEGDSVPALFPWVSCVREITQSRAGDALAAFSALPESWRSDESRNAESENPFEGKYPLFDEVTAALLAAAQSDALIISLDNLHCADQLSLELLEYLAPSVSDSRLLIVGTYRGTEIGLKHPFSATLGLLASEPGFSRLRLHRLEGPDIGELTTAMLGVTLPQAKATELHDRTDGNALFVTEILRDIAGDGFDEKSFSAELDRKPVAEGVRQAIARRLGQVSENTLETLIVAATIGRTFVVELLQRVMNEADLNEMLERIRTAVERDFIEETGGVGGEYRFTHALIRDALLVEVSTIELSRLHVRVASALRALYGEDDARYAKTLFEHYLAATDVLGTEEMVRYAIIAADAHAHNYAFADARFLIDRAVDVKRRHHGDTQAPDKELAELIFCRGRAEVASPVLDMKQKASLRGAFDAFIRHGENGLATDVALYRYRHPPSLWVLQDLMDRAYEIVEKGSVEEAWILFHRAESSIARGTPRLELFEEVIDLAHAHGDTVLGIRALEMKGSAKRRLSLHESGRNDIAASVELSEKLADPQTHARHLSVVCLHHLLHGEPDDALAAIRRMDGLTRNDPRYAKYSHRLTHAKTVYHLYKGEYDAAISCCRTGTSRARRRQSMWIGLDDAMVRLDSFAQGEADLVKARALTDIRSKWPNQIFATLRVCWLFGVTEVFGRAKEVIDEILSDAGSPQIAVFFCQCALALIAYLEGDVDTTRKLYPAIICGKGTMGPGALMGICFDRFLGLLCTSLGELNQAEEYFESATAFCTRAGYTPELAETYYDHAGLLLLQGGQEYRRSAQAKLDSGLRMAVEIGIKPLEKLIRERLNSAMGVAGPSSGRAVAQSNAAGLTAREVEVLTLVTRGHTNAEIGDRLFISSHTCATHVQHILRKTDTANRAELAAYAIRHQLAT